MNIPGGWGGVGFPQSDPPRLWGDSLFLGLKGGADICSLSWALLPLALGIPSVSSHYSHIPQIINVEAVDLFIPRTQFTAMGRVSPELSSGATQVVDKGCFLLLSTAGLLWKWHITASDCHVLDQPRNLLMFGENSSIATEMTHEVGGDSAEVKSQDVPVVVGIGSLTGKALIAGRARRVVATQVAVGLCSLFLITVSIKGILPGLPCTGVVVPLLATALELPLQLGQSMQLPLDGVSSWEVAWHGAEAS